MAQCPMHQMDIAKLLKDILNDKRLIFEDALTREIIDMILSRFVSTNSVVDWVDSVAVERCTIKLTAQASTQSVVCQYF